VINKLSCAFRPFIRGVILSSPEGSHPMGRARVITTNCVSAASYVNRILNGEKPAELPVQAPTKLVISLNVRTARTLGLEIPATLMALADEVIE
jgi:ABC transporter substrate binding protein